MTSAARDLAAIARKQNDRDFAAGLLASRYVEDPAVLDRVAVLIDGTGPPTNSKGPGASRRGLATLRTTEEVIAS